MSTSTWKSTDSKEGEMGEETYTEHEGAVEAGEVNIEELAVTVETKIRTTLFFIAWLNQVFAFFGAPTLELDFAEVYGVVSSILTFAISVWAWWKNNSFTKPALLGDVVKEEARRAVR